MNLGLEGKRALVTGGSHGIGLATAIDLTKEGCSVAICSRSLDRLSQAAAKIGPSCLAIQSDLMTDDRYKVVRQVNQEWGGIDILINNVGGGGRWGSEDMLKTPTSVWGEVHEKNLGVAVHFINAFLPHMLENKWGRIICVSSVYGKQAGGRPWFNVSKSAQIALMANLSLSKSYAGEGVTFNSVAPGPIMIEDTGWEDINDPECQKAIDRIPTGRLGNPEDVSSVIAFLCSDLAGHVNGTCTSIDGGESVCL